MSGILVCLGLLRLNAFLLGLLEEGSRPAILHWNACPSALKNRLWLPKPEFNGAEIADIYSGDHNNSRTVDHAGAVTTAL